MKEFDDQRFVTAGNTDDPLSAQGYASALRQAGIPVLVHEGRAGGLDLLTVPTPDFWEIRVPENLLPLAREVMAEEKERQRLSGPAEDSEETPEPTR
jgi:hypothetical protein